MEKLIKGADLSTLLEVEECGGKFYDGGREADAMEILQSHGVGLVRLRLWNDPYGPDGQPYGAGTCDLPRVMKLAARAKALGLPWMLDLHYSDFWADPAKQFPPKAWAGMDAAALAKAVHVFTRKTLKILQEKDLLPAYVAVGNEITNGLLWPVGKRPEDASMVRLINSGIRAVRETAPAAKVMLHLDNGGNNAMYRDWFGAYSAHGGEDPDMIGLSYYPFWHGTMEDLRQNMTWLVEHVRKPMMIAETSMAFTYEAYAFRELPEGSWACETADAGSVTDRKPLAANAELGRGVPYPGTPQGQAAYLRDLAAVIRSVPDDLCKGFIWWEPAWIPAPGSGWATPAALEYIREKGPGGNEWANQALFDYAGNALPALQQLQKI